MIKPDNNILFTYIVLFKDIVLGALGGMIVYLFDYSKAKRMNIPFTFMFSSMIVNMALGAFVAYIVGTVIPMGTYARDAMVGLSGVTAYNILMLAESRFAGLIMDKLTGSKK